jgi:hypothetical protein
VNGTEWVCDLMLHKSVTDAKPGPSGRASRLAKQRLAQETDDWASRADGPAEQMPEYAVRPRDSLCCKKKSLSRYTAQ